MYCTIYLSSSMVVVDHRFPCGRSCNNAWYILYHLIMFYETLFDTWKKNVLRLIHSLFFKVCNECEANWSICFLGVIFFVRRLSCAGHIIFLILYTSYQLWNPRVRIFFTLSSQRPPPSLSCSLSPRLLPAPIRRPHSSAPPDGAPHGLQ